MQVEARIRLREFGDGRLVVEAQREPQGLAASAQIADAGPAVVDRALQAARPRDIAVVVAEVGCIDAIGMDDEVAGFGIGRPVEACVHALHRRHRGGDAGDACMCAARIRGQRGSEPGQRQQE